MFENKKQTVRNIILFWQLKKKCDFILEAEMKPNTPEVCILNFFGICYDYICESEGKLTNKKN